MEERKTKALNLLSKLQDNTPQQSNGSKSRSNFEECESLLRNKAFIIIIIILIRRISLFKDVVKWGKKWFQNSRRHDKVFICGITDGDEMQVTQTKNLVGN